MLTRPPPLQLVFDNTASGLRPASVPRPQLQLLPVVASRSRFFVEVGVFAAQVYRANWRNFVIAITTVNAFRFTVTAVRHFPGPILPVSNTFFVTQWSSFRDADIDFRTYRISKLAQISLALGALYLLTALTQIFGVISTAMQRPKSILAYVYLAFLAALLVSTAGFIKGVEYFMLAEDIIEECVALAISGSWISKTIFRGKLRHGQVPGTKLAQEQCHTAWSRGSFSQVLGIFVFSVIPAIIFFFLAYTYYRQTTDPTHSACLNPKNGDVAYVRMEAYPDHNGPTLSGIQDGHDDNGNRNRNRTRAAPLGVPLVQQNPNQNRAAALFQQMRTASDSPYGVTPGPPSYAPPYEYGQIWFEGAGRGR